MMNDIGAVQVPVTDRTGTPAANLKAFRVGRRSVKHKSGVGVGASRYDSEHGQHLNDVRGCKIAIDAGF